MRNVYLPLQLSNLNLHRSKWRTTCCDHLPKFHLNRTVNESENAVLQKLRKLEKLVAPSARISSLEPGSTKLLLGGSCSAKIRKTTFFMNQNTTHHWYGAWLPKGCRQAVPAPPNLTPFITTLISDSIGYDPSYWDYGSSLTLPIHEFIHIFHLD